jgi:hypothetical protein
MPGTDALMRNASLAGLGGIALAVALLATPGAALSQDARANSRITEADCRNRAQTDEQIVVCGKRPGEDPYRVPKGFRKQTQGRSGGTSLAVDVMGSGIPGAGSNIGAAGSAFQSKGLYEQWLAEQNAAKKAAETPR